MPNLMGSYSPNDVAVSIDGVPITGFAEGSFIDAEFDTDAATMTEGADGNAAVAMKKGMRKGTVTLRLMQTALANNLLNTYLKAQQGAAFAGAFPNFQVLNMQGGERVSMPRAVIAKEPQISYSDGIEAREWKIVGQMTVEPLGYGV